MAAWERCPKGSFYRRRRKHPEPFSDAFVDPVDLVLVHTMPWQGTSVTVIRWQIAELKPHTFFEELRGPEAEILVSWARRVVDEMEGGISLRQKDALLDDLDVDAAERDRLLDAVELFVNISPPESTTFDHRKVPRTREAVEGLLFHYGIGPC